LADIPASRSRRDEPVSTTWTKVSIAANRSIVIPTGNKHYGIEPSAAATLYGSLLASTSCAHGIPPLRESPEKPMSLQARLNAFKTDFEAGKPPYSVPRSEIDTMHRAPEELTASGAAALARKAGDVAASIVLNDPDGRAVSSAGLLALGGW
jgi:hypothetical protein